VIALSTVSILSLTVIRTIRLADQDIIRKVTSEHRLLSARRLIGLAGTDLPKGPERIEALKQAGRLRMAADRKRIRFAPLGRPKRGLQGPLSITR
jgi:hypothetical protein